jgi:hypothetical protein
MMLSEALRLTQRIFEHLTFFGIGIANPNLIRTTAVLTPQPEIANVQTLFIEDKKTRWREYSSWHLATVSERREIRVEAGKCDLEFVLT